MSDKNSIFRKTSLERISSPEQLNDYIKVSHPSVWLVLVTVSVLLAGVLVWSVFGTLTTTRDTVAVVMDQNAICYLHPEQTTDLAVGIPVQIGDSVGTVTDIAITPMEITADFEAYTLYLGGFQMGDFVTAVGVDTDLPEGIYPAKLILEHISPISFILN